MYKSKKLNGTSSEPEALLTAGTGISILSNEIHIDDTLVATDTQLAAATTGLVTQAALSTAIDTFVSQDELTAATGSFVTDGQLTTATSGHALIAGENTFTKQNAFSDRTYFTSMYVQAANDIHGAAAGIAVFRELELLRSHYTTPTWVTATLDSANFEESDYEATPQYTRFLYGSEYMVKVRGQVKEKGDYLNATSTRVLFVLPEGYRPAR